jgi:hypothetical protein
MIDKPGKAGRKIVEHNHVFAGIGEMENHVGTDISGSARDQNSHDLCPSLLNCRSHIAEAA